MDDESTLSNLKGLLQDAVDSPFWSDDLLGSSELSAFARHPSVDPTERKRRCDPPTPYESSECGARAWACVDQVCVLKPLSLCKAAAYLPCSKRCCRPEPKCPCPKRDRKHKDCDGWEYEFESSAGKAPRRCECALDALLVASKEQLEAYKITDAESIFTLAFKFCFKVKDKPYLRFALDGRLACKSIFGTALAQCDSQPTLDEAAWILLEKHADPLKHWQFKHVAVSPGFELDSSGSVKQCPAAFCLPFTGKGVLVLKPSLLSVILQACVERLTQDYQTDVPFADLLECYKRALCSLLPVELLVSGTVIE